MTGEYDDIINLPHHVSKTRPQMSMLERAAQFAPFQALTGYGAAIQETARLTEDKIELGDEDIALLNAKLQVLADHLPESPEVCIVWFKPDERKAGGSYVKTTGKVKRIDDVAGLISLQSGEKIRLESIVNIESDIVLSYDYTVTELCNEFGLPKEILQTVFFREQRFDWFLDTGADIVVAASYSYDHALEKWMALPELEQMTTPQPQMPVGYRHDCSTGLCQIFASTAINSINFAVDTGIISDERKYDSENLEDLEIIWYKLRDDDKFNLKCAVLTLMYEALSTLGYDDNFSDYTDDQIAMLFTKYNSTDELPNDYGKDCTNWYRIFKKYK